MTLRDDILDSAKDYERWFFNERDDATGFPFGTLLLHRVADNDEVRFARGEYLLSVAFAAGRAAGRKAEREEKSA